MKPTGKPTPKLRNSMSRRSVTAVALALTALLSACGAASEPPPGPATYPGVLTPQAMPAQVPPAAADYARCQQACATLTACGVGFGESCASDCMRMPVFLSCVQAAPNECNALALCAFRQGATTCGGTPGVPSGTQTCGAAALCEGMCTVAEQPAACACACAAGLQPGQAIKLLINNQCAVQKCGAVCRPGGSGAACISCFQSSCQAESAQCTGDAPAVPTAPATPMPAPTPNVPMSNLPTPEAQAGLLDPLLFGAWPLEAVHVTLDGTTAPNLEASRAVEEKLGPQQLQLGSDGHYWLGAGTGTWTVVPFTAADRARWGTGGLGPQGYARKLVLTNGQGVTIEGPITDIPPAGSAPTRLQLGTHFDGPPPGTLDLVFVRRLNAPSPGVKR
jgi:hypothetical protein